MHVKLQLKDLCYEKPNEKCKVHKTRLHVTYKVGNRILATKIVNVKGKSKKLFFNWIGMHTIVDKAQKVKYTVQAIIGKRRQRETVHVDKLKPYYERPDNIFQSSQTADNSTSNREIENLDNSQPFNQSIVTSSSLHDGDMPLPNTCVCPEVSTTNTITTSLSTISLVNDHHYSQPFPNLQTTKQSTGDTVDNLTKTLQSEKKKPFGESTISPYNLRPKNQSSTQNEKAGYISPRLLH